MQHSSGYIIVDGVAAPGRFLDGPGETFRTGFRTSLNTERPFMFSHISGEVARGSPVGTVELKIMLIKPDGEQVNTNLIDRPYAGRQDIPAGPEMPYHPQEIFTRQGKPLNPPGRSHVKFYFHYRSLENFAMVTSYYSLNTPPTSTLISSTIGAPNNWALRPPEDYTNESESELESESESEDGTEGEDSEMLRRWNRENNTMERLSESFSHSQPIAQAQAQVQPHPSQLQHHPRAFNTYAFPSNLSSSSNHASLGYGSVVAPAVVSARSQLATQPSQAPAPSPVGVCLATGNDGRVLQLYPVSQMPSHHSDSRHQQDELIEDPRKKYQCSQCPRAYVRANDLKAHLATHDPLRLNPFTCTHSGCGRSFSRRANLDRHLETHDPLRSKLFTCTHSGCGHSFYSERELDRHLVTHDPLRPKLFTCKHSGCGRSFSRRYHLDRHLVTHDPLRPKPFICTHAGCGLPFSLKHHLDRHLVLIHHDESAASGSAYEEGSDSGDTSGEVRTGVSSVSSSQASRPSEKTTIRRGSFADWPPEVPGRAPSGPPSAIIDTRVFLRGPPAHSPTASPAYAATARTEPPRTARASVALSQVSVHLPFLFSRISNSISSQAHAGSSSFSSPIYGITQPARAQVEPASYMSLPSSSIPTQASSSSGKGKAGRKVSCDAW